MTNHHCEFSKKKYGKKGQVYIYFYNKDQSKPAYGVQRNFIDNWSYLYGGGFTVYYRNVWGPVIVCQPWFIRKEDSTCSNVKYSIATYEGAPDPTCSITVGGGCTSESSANINLGSTVQLKLSELSNMINCNGALQYCNVQTLNLSNTECQDNAAHLISYLNQQGGNDRSCFVYEQCPTNTIIPHVDATNNLLPCACINTEWDMPEGCAFL